MKKSIQSLLVALVSAGALAVGSSAFAGHFGGGSHGGSSFRPSQMNRSKMPKANPFNTANKTLPGSGSLASKFTTPTSMNQKFSQLPTNSLAKLNSSPAFKSASPINSTANPSQFKTIGNVKPLGTPIKSGSTTPGLAKANPGSFKGVDKAPTKTGTTGTGTKGTGTKGTGTTKPPKKGKPTDGKPKKGDGTQQNQNGTGSTDPNAQDSGAAGGGLGSILSSLLGSLGGGGGSGGGGGDDGGGSSGGGGVASSAPVAQETQYASAPVAQSMQYAEAAPAIPTTYTAAEEEVAPNTAIDLELLEVRQIDAGDAENGPAYRVTFRNNSAMDVTQPFDIAIYASTSRQLTSDVPQATAQANGMQAGQTLAAEFRLPVEANNMGQNISGMPVAFTWLTAVVDPSQSVQDSSRDNNIVVLNRNDVLVVEAK